MQNYIYFILQNVIFQTYKKYWNSNTVMKYIFGNDQTPYAPERKIAKTIFLKILLFAFSIIMCWFTCFMIIYRFIFIYDAYNNGWSFVGLLELQAA